MEKETKLTEKELAAIAVAKLQEEGWSVYQEISPHGGYTLDILAEQGGIFLAIEAKKTMKVDVLSQAYFWKPYVHYSFALVPSKKIRHYFWREIARNLGVGLLELEIRRSSWRREDPYMFFDNLDIHLNKNSIPFRSGHLYNKRPNITAWKPYLKPEYQHAADAGGRGGHRVTPFKITVAELIKAAEETPGIPLPDLVARVKTHWCRPSVAINCIIRHINTGVISELELKKENGVWLVSPRKDNET